MPNQHNNSRLMRVQNETAEKIAAVADHESRAMNAQLALIVDEWCSTNGWEFAMSPTLKPARKDTPMTQARRTR